MSVSASMASTIIRARSNAHAARNSAALRVVARARTSSTQRPEYPQRSTAYAATDENPRTRTPPTRPSRSNVSPSASRHGHEVDHAEPPAQTLQTIHVHGYATSPARPQAYCHMRRDLDKTPAHRRRGS